MGGSSTWFYAIYRGHAPGVYDTWDRAKREVENFPGAIYKKFGDRPRAEAFVKFGPPADQASLAKAAVAMLAPSTSGCVKRSAGDIRAFAATPSSAPSNPQAASRVDLHVLTNLAQARSRAPSSATTGGSVDLSRSTQEGGSSGIAVYTDGSCLFQGTPRAASGIGVIFPSYPEFNLSQPIVEEPGVRATNNRAEIQAIMEAFLRADRIDPSRTRTLTIYSDSEYSIKILTQWLTAWKRMNWRRKTGEPVLNRDLLEQLDKMRNARTFRALHVRAHTGRQDEHSRFNDLADRAANAAALEAHHRRGSPRTSVDQGRA